MPENTKNKTVKKPHIVVFSTKNWVIDSFNEINKNFGYELSYHEARLYHKTSALAAGADVVCVFVNDKIDAQVITDLKKLGVKLIALRCAGFNNVDIDSAYKEGMPIARVPAYSPYAVAEHTLGLILALNRKYHKAYVRVREGNFALDGLLGFDLHKKTVGIIGTGKIGQILINLLLGFECQILAHDKFPNIELEKSGIQYVDLHELYQNSDIVSLHCPLTFETYHLINEYWTIYSLLD